MTRAVKYTTFALTLILLAGACCLLRSTFAGRIESGFELAHADWLPSSASNISFVRRLGFGHCLFYEFHISETDFRALARNRNWRLTPVAQGWSVARFTLLLPENDPRHREPFYITAEAGYCYDKHAPNGAGTRVLYDKSTSTAYVENASR